MGDISIDRVVENFELIDFLEGEHKMVSNKLLSIKECYFNLPDDFDGTLGDALMLLAKHRLQLELEQNINNEDNETDCYTKLMNNKDIKCSIKYSLSKMSDDKTRWETL